MRKEVILNFWSEKNSFFKDQADLESYVKNFRAAYNDNSDLRKTWGGGHVGIKSQHQKDLRVKALEREALKKAGIK